MKITLINGGANGYGQGIEKIIEIVSNTLKELEVNVTEINLSLLKLPYYDGTNYASVEKIINELKSSDGIIFACSALKFSPSAVMQTFIEHLDPYLYGDFIAGKNCFTIVSSYDASEYFADEYLNRVLRSIGAFGAVRLSAGREYAQRIAFDSSVIDIIEKHTEDFYRILKRNTQFIISQSEISSAENNSPKPQSEPKYQNEKYTPQYSENEYYEFENNKDYVPKYADNYENKKSSYTESSHFSSHNSEQHFQKAYDVKKENQYYNEPEKYQQPKKSSSQSINFSGFDKQQEADINELTKLLADEYNKSESSMPDYSRAKSVSNLYKNSFSMNEQVIPHVKTCKQKTQSLYHHFNSQLAKGLDAVIQLNISGNESFSACLTIGDGECTYSEGVHHSPSVTIFSDSVIWNNILDGKLTSQKAFMVGQIKVKGNFALLSKFDQLFKM